MTHHLNVMHAPVKFHKYIPYGLGFMALTRIGTDVRTHVCTGRTRVKKKVREKSRECHNHKPQPFPDPKRKRKHLMPFHYSLNRRGHNNNDFINVFIIVIGGVTSLCSLAL